MKDELTELIDRLDRTAYEIREITALVVVVIQGKRRDLEARLVPDDEWKRMPTTWKTCKISGWNRARIMAEIERGKVRRHIYRGSLYYSGGDVRRLIAETQ